MTASLSINSSASRRALGALGDTHKPGSCLAQFDAVCYRAFFASSANPTDAELNIWLNDAVRMKQIRQRL